MGIFVIMFNCKFEYNKSRAVNTDRMKGTVCAMERWWEGGRAVAIFSTFGPNR